MRVVAKRALREFWYKHGDAEGPLKAWYHEVHRADWPNPSRVKTRYPSASFLSENRVVFNIAGNKYRLVVGIRYDLGIVFVHFVGTHAEYDRLNF